MRWLIAACVAVALPIGTAKAATPPVIISVSYGTGTTTVKFAGYGQTDSYGVEFSRSPGYHADSGHFLSPLNVVKGLPLRYDGTQTWYLRRRLTPGRYYVRVYDDYTATEIEALAALGKMTGGAPTWNGQPFLSWSSTTSFMVR